MVLLSKQGLKNYYSKKKVVCRTKLNQKYKHLIIIVHQG